MKKILPSSMFSKKVLFGCLLFSVAYVQPARALYWLTNGANSDWDTSSLNWATNSGGTAQAWTNNAIAIFDDATGGTINVKEAITNNYLLFTNTGSWTLSSATSNTITTTISGTILNQTSSNATVTIGPNVTIQSSANTSTFRALGTLNVSGRIIGQALANQNLNVGSMGNLNVTNGGLLLSYATVVLGNEATRPSVINVNGGTIQAGETNVTSTNSSIVLANANTNTTTLNVNSGLVMTKKTDGASSTNVTLNALRFGPTSVSTNSVGTVNLNGGTLAVARIYEGNTSASSTFNFNGGTLKVSDYINTNQAAIFMEGIDNASVLAGGAKIDTSGKSVTMNQLLQSGTASDGGLTKLGAGTLVLTAANTYNGATTLQGGVINFGSLSNLGTGSSIVFDGGGLQYGVGNTVDISTRTLTFNAGGGTIDTDTNNITLANAIGNSGAGGLTKVGTGTLTLTAANSYTGSTVVGAGVMNIQNGSALGTGSAGATVSNAATLQLQGGITVAGKSLSIAGSGVGSTGALQNVSGNNTWSGDLAVNTAAQARIESTAGTLTLGGTTTLTGTNANGLIFQGAGTIVVNGKITGNGTVTRGGTPSGGTLVLNGANDYTGGTLIARDSYINIGNDSAFGTGAVGVGSGNSFFAATGGARTLSNSFSLVNATGTTFTGSNNITINGSFTGYSSSSRVTNTMSSGATLTLAGNVYLTSADNSRTLYFGSAVTNGAAGTTILISGNIANNSAANTAASALVANGGGTVILSGSNTYTGTTQLGNGAGETAGILQVGNGGTAGNLGAGAVTLNAGTLVFKRSDEMTVANAISGAGGVTQSGAGKTILSGSNNYAGQTTVSSGSLLINGDQSSATGALSVAVGATLGGSGTIGAASTISGMHSPGNSPGVQTFTNGISYLSGATFVWELIANTNAVGERGTSFDGVNVTGGTLAIGTAVTNNLVFNSSGSSVAWSDAFWSSDRTWLIFSNAGVPSIASGSIFDTINIGVDSTSASLGSVRPGASFSWNTVANDVYLNYQAVPEPSTYALLALAGFGFAGHLIRRRRR